MRKILRIFLGSFGQSPKLHSCIEYGGGFLKAQPPESPSVAELVEAVEVTEAVKVNKKLLKFHKITVIYVQNLDNFD